MIERSRTVPVVVDFWAEWCGPCRQLGPLLERAAGSREGKVVLAKLDTDSNQELARRFDIRGIPAVKAFRDGRVVDEFVGAIPPPQVERFFDTIVPSEADALVAAGDEQSLRRALELEPGRADAAVPLARILLAGGDRPGAQEVLGTVTASDFQAEGLAARIRLLDAADRDPALAPLADTFALLDGGEVQTGLDQLLAALATVDGERDDVRRVIVGELDALGPADPLARDARRRLASALY